MTDTHGHMLQCCHFDTIRFVVFYMISVNNLVEQMSALDNAMYRYAHYWPLFSPIHLLRYNWLDDQQSKTMVDTGHWTCDHIVTLPFSIIASK